MRLHCMILAVCIALPLTGCLRARAEPALQQSVTVNEPAINPGRPVCVGDIAFEGSGTLYYDVAAESGSGLFVGLYTEPELPDGPITWEVQMMGFLWAGDERTIRTPEGVGHLDGTYYIYIGSEDTALTGVAGDITYDAAEQ